MARVLVLGSSNTDMSVRLPQLPTPGQTVLGGSLLTGPGGKGANQAVAAARAGGEVVFVAAVGDDAFGRSALDGLRRENVDVTHVRTQQGAASGVALILVNDEGENMIGVAPGANDSLGADDVDRLPDDLFTPDRLLLIAGLEVPMSAVGRAVLRASRAGMTVVLNPAPFRPELITSDILTYVDVVTPNRVELTQLTRVDSWTVEGELKAAEMLQSMGRPLGVVVTLGSGGCLVLHEDREVIIPAYPADSVDTVGAGDAFNGALAVALAEGRTLSEAAQWATAAASLAVTRPGAQAALPYRAAIDRLAGGA